MQNSILVQVFRSLNKKEIRELRKFVRSPFFNQREDVIQLFDFLADHSEASAEKLEKTKVFPHIFPEGGAYDDSQMRYAMSFLLDAIRQYLAYREMNSDEVFTQIHLIRALRKKSLDSLFEKEWAGALALQEKQPYRNVRYHYHNYLLYQEHYDQLSLQQRSGDLHLQEMSNHLSTFYIADILRQSCIMLTHQNMSQQRYHLALLSEILPVLERGEFMDIPLVAIYYHAYRALNNPAEDQYFQTLKQLIETHWKHFPESEIRDIYMLALNYCIRKINGGESRYMREAFDLYRSGLENRVLFENGILTKYTYKNAMTAGLWLQEFDWVRRFLDEYKEYLHPRERENTYRYNLANYYFRKPDYDQAMKLLQQVEFRDVLYNLDARRMLLRIYYELEEYDPLMSLLDSFSTYIRRQREVGYHKDNYLNLIRFVKKMLNSNLRDHKVRQQIREEIEQTHALAERSWLMEQLK